MEHEEENEREQLDPGIWENVQVCPRHACAGERNRMCVDASQTKNNQN